MGQGRECIAVVTGASRGAGKGIAKALAAAGATVYITGRSWRAGEAALPGSLTETAAEIDAAGGVAIPVRCDHSRDEEVEALFARVREDHGRLDILVNNATGLHDALTTTGPFWEKPLDLTAIWDVGMRSHYTASWYAAPLLLANGEGLVVNTSSFGGRIYMHGPAYGAGKAAVDKMAHDMAVDFRPHKVAVISLWMGLLLTERTRQVFDAEPDKYADLVATAEHPEFSGRVIAALWADPGRMAHTGTVCIGAELGEAYGVTDIDGGHPPSHRAFFGPPTTFGDAVVE
ncbi:MAG: SDR family NAD(P)-dependent oxidoreductase [Haliea sp.]|uniref:SDR family NAD(P)-dependent oxidoreductase n=1 Tax=Haliea sp. TaxID=1932666 RepID=UPI0032ED5642